MQRKKYPPDFKAKVALEAIRETGLQERIHPFTSRIMKNQVLKIAELPSQIEKAHDLIHGDLSILTQELTVIS